MEPEESFMTQGWFWSWKVVAEAMHVSFNEVQKDQEGGGGGGGCVVLLSSCIH